MYTVHIDYVSRLAAMQQAVREAGLAALVGTRLKTVTHACGAFCPWRSTVLVPAEGEVELICPGMDAMRLEQEGWLSRVYGYSRQPMMEMVGDRLGLPAGGLHQPG